MYEGNNIMETIVKLLIWAGVFATFRVAYLRIFDHDKVWQQMADRWYSRGIMNVERPPDWDYKMTRNGYILVVWGVIEFFIAIAVSFFIPWKPM